MYAMVLSVTHSVDTHFLQPELGDGGGEGMGEREGGGGGGLYKCMVPYGMAVVPVNLKAQK